MGRVHLVGTVFAAALVACGSACSGDADDGGGGGSGATGTSTSSSGQGGGGAVGAAGSEGGAGAADLRELYCSGRVARDEQCPGDPSDEPETLEQCLASSQTTCFFEAVRPEIIEDLITCLNERPCNQSDDLCFYEVGAANPAPGQEAYMAKCSAKVSACPGDFKSDYCSMTIATAALYAQLSTCFDLDCADVRDCISSFWPAACQ